MKLKVQNELFVVGADGMPKRRLVIIDDNECGDWLRARGGRAMGAYFALLVAMSICGPADCHGIPCRGHPAKYCPVREAGRHLLDAWMHLAVLACPPANH